MVGVVVEEDDFCAAEFFLEAFGGLEFGGEEAFWEYAAGLLAEAEDGHEDVTTKTRRPRRRTKDFIIGGEFRGKGLESGVIGEALWGVGGAED